MVIELKDDSEIYGKILETDHSMTVLLGDVKQISRLGNVTILENLHINGSSIRYVHIPKQLNVVSKLKTYVSTITRISKSSRPHELTTAASSNKRKINQVDEEVIIDVN